MTANSDIVRAPVRRVTPRREKSDKRDLIHDECSTHDEMLRTTGEVLKDDVAADSDQ